MLAIKAALANETAHPVYTPRQLNQYFKTIKLPPKYLSHPIIKYKSVAESNDTEALRVLKYLIRYQLTNIPFENLELHYSNNHTVSINPDHLFRKMVDRKTGRGGYCMENTHLFVTVLRSLGYKVTATGARVNRIMQPTSQRSSNGGVTYDVWNHMVAIVTIGRKKYLIDVGFGNNSPTFPVPLEDGHIDANGRSSHQLRLSRERIPNYIPEGVNQTPQTQLMWVYSVRSSEKTETPWIPAYCFSELEFPTKSFEAISMFVSKNPKSWFTQKIICTKFLMDRETTEIIGDVTMFKREVKERKNGWVKVLAVLNCEKDRLEALQKYMHIRLSETEKKGIEGKPTMLHPI